MKGLSIEEKAKAYDKLLVKLQEAKVDNNVCDERYCCVIDDIVPELKESEDEKIRKQIRAFIKSRGSKITQSKTDAWLAWLEKHGEQDMIPLDKAIKFLDDQLINDKDEVTGEPFINFQNYGAFKETFISFFKRKMLEKQGKESPLKGTLGDVFDDLKFGIDPSPKQDDEKIRKELINYFSNFHLKTFAGIDPKKIITWLEQQKEYESTDFDYVWKATDCSELTSALDRYSEDAIKKVCHAWYDKGIELERRNWLVKQGKQKPAWGEEDDDDAWLNDIISKAECNLQLNKGDINWLKSLKDRVQPQPKQEWSEEDEANFQCALSYVNSNPLLEDVNVENCRTWLKSIKDRVQHKDTWKPSEEHIHWLIWVINRMPDIEKANEAEAVLRDLLEQLNKLKEE